MKEAKVRFLSLTRERNDTYKGTSQTSKLPMVEWIFKVEVVSLDCVAQLKLPIKTILKQAFYTFFTSKSLDLQESFS